MIRSTGRAIHHTSRAVHWLLALGTGILVVITCLLAAATWRLAQGPIDLGAWSDRVRSALVDDTAPVRFSFEGMSLAWEGFQKGADYPLDLRLSDVAVTDAAGRHLVAAPRAHLTFSLAGLLLGRVVPRTVEVDHAQIVVTRDPGEAIRLGSGLAEADQSDAASIDLAPVREQLARPASSDHGRSRGLFDQIQRIHFRDTGVLLRDRQSGFVVQSSDLDLDLIRAAMGHVRASVRAPLQVGDQRASLIADADWAVGSDNNLDLRLTPLRPSGLGKLPPELAFAGAIDLPVSLAATVGMDAAFKPTRIRAELQLGQGRFHIGQGEVPLRSGRIQLSGTPREINLTGGHFDLAHNPAGNPEIVDVRATVGHQADRITASLKIGIGSIDIADFPRLWPVGVGGGARPWIVEHVTAGTAAHGTASFTIEADDALHEVVLTKATADLDGSNATFTWIDNMPPVEQADVHLHLADPDTLDIHLSSARQRVRNGGADLVVKDGQMRITGLSLKDQTAAIHTQVEGPVASALALLKEPRLHLLSVHPIAVKVSDGDATATLDFQFPLVDKLLIDDVRIHADAQLTQVRLPDVAGGHELDDGVFDMAVDKDGLSLKGQGSLAAIPVTLDGTMDFTAGPPSQVVQKIALTGQPDAAKLAAAGLHLTDVLGGSVPMTVVVMERRGGDGSIAVNGDLTLATLSIDPLAWTKPSGTVANLSATLLMSHDRLTRVDKFALRGDDLLLTGSADFADGHIRTVLLDTIRLGRTQGHGTVHLPQNEPLKVVLQGDQIDLSARLTEKSPHGDKPDRSPVVTPDWVLNARFDHAILGNGESAGDLLVKASGQGEQIGLADVVGTMRAGAGFSLKIEPRAGQRHLLVEAKDAGSFLRGMDAIKGMRSGRLAIDGVFSAPSGLYPLAGTAIIDDVVVRNSPFLGKLLQAITLYGLVDVLRGPGMNFSRIVVPFRYEGGYLSVDEANAYNPSLGLTANGRIGLLSGQTSLTGTIVPAYFFNSMLGQLPLVGKLFSPERGGGIFAARFSVSGQIDDPSISVNPISALTPGFMRGIFGAFEQSSKPAKDAGPAAGR